MRQNFDIVEFGYSDNDDFFFLYEWIWDYGRQFLSPKLSQRN